MHKLFLLILIYFSMATLAHAQTNILTTGVRNFSFTAYVPNTTNLNEYGTHHSLHNSLDYYFYNQYFNVHTFIGFPSLYTSADASTQLKNNESLYTTETNKFDRSTFFGVTASPTITLDVLYPLAINLSVGPSALIYSYQFFFISNDIIDITSDDDRYYYPLNTTNFGLGVEGSVVITYFLNDAWGISAALQASYYWMFNNKKFPTNTIVDITSESALDDKDVSSYGISLGGAYKF